ncbi:hypothetical protein EVAR_89375_1 [Eumeta japonica]|uniref:Uncharacterized protein n=1 Tax=Eumeta variegata TaxID=151549 RepID=A0A4C1ZP57_EUMVA|nr:hypothetical protein EVAR_89375_1 [Eumeta japonica]
MRPRQWEYVVGEYVQAREVYGAVAEAQTASWKRFCSAQDGESLTSNRSGQVSDPLAETFSLMTVSILTIRIIRKSEGEPTGVVNHPKLRGSARVDPPLPELRLGLLLKHSSLERPRH